MEIGKDIDFKEGQVLIFNKPLTWTSFDLVNKVRKLIERNLEESRIKVGHAGTLDPLATGLMILCTGKATKRVSEFQNLEKEYIAIMELGKTTPSFDKETEVDGTYPISHITKEKIINALDKFKGKTEQIPPLFSAKNVKGERAYNLARKGEKPILPPSEITIYEIELIEYATPMVRFMVRCSKGTYIRALARDAGIALKSGAYLTSLIRTKIGPYNLDHALSIEEFEKKVKNLKQN